MRRDYVWLLVAGQWRKVRETSLTASNTFSGSRPANIHIYETVADGPKAPKR